MAFSPGSGTAVVLSIVIALVGVIVLVIGAGSATGVFGGVLVATGTLFAVLNMMLLKRGR